jgi:PAS domain S-box-containing protein
MISLNIDNECNKDAIHYLKSGGFKKHQAIFITFIIGILISIIAFNLVLTNHKKKLEENFRSNSHIRMLLLENQLRNNLKKLEIFGDIASSMESKQAEFASFITHILRHTQFEAITWVIPKNGNYEVELYKTKEGFSSIISMDNKVIVDYIRIAIQEKRNIVTEQFAYTGTRGVKNNIAMILPIFKQNITLSANNGNNQIVGVVVGILNLEDFFRKSLSLQTHLKSHAQIYIYDITAPQQTKLLYYFDGIIKKFFENLEVKFNHYTIGKEAPFSYMEPINLLSRNWIIHFVPTPNYIKHNLNIWPPWIILSCGMLITSLIAAFLYHLIDRNAQIHKLASQRTEQLQQATQILEDNQNRLQTVLYTVVDGIITIDSHGVIQSTNPATEKIFGYKSEELIGQDVQILFPNSHIHRYRRYINYFFNSNQQKIREVGEIEAKKKDGTIFSIEIGASTVKIGKEMMLVGILRDITERKNTEYRLALYASEVEKERNKAEAASKAKSQFLANMSHEIRTPMNSMIGMTELLMNSKLTLEQQEYIKTIHASGDMLLAIINDILDLSKIEAGELTVNNNNVVLYELIAEIVQLLTPRAKDHNLEIIVRFDANVPQYIITDPVKLRQVIINLVGNAIKFSKDSYVFINISAEVNTDSNANILFEIRDNGIGISHDKLDTIFASFTQADESTTRRYGGTGLGLAICKKLVNMMNGQVGVKSTLHKGSIFWFKIEVQTIITKEIYASDELKAQRVLILDNSPISQNITKEYLDYALIKADTSFSPRDAYNKIIRAEDASKPYAFVLIDSLIEEEEWTKFAVEVKSNPQTEHIKLILVTSFDKLDNVNLITKLKFCTYLIKPICMITLIDTLNNALKSNPTVIAPLKQDSISEQQLTQLHANILVVEDYPPNQRLAKKMLEKFGCKVDIAPGGLEALEILKQNSYDLIFMDCQMPHMDGYETTRKIRKLPEGKNILIVAMTANALIGDKEKCLNAGMNDYLAKPMKQKDLENILTTWILPLKEKVELQEAV